MRYQMLWTLLGLLVISPSGLAQYNTKLVIDSAKKIGPLSHFWKSTGFCPPLPHESAASFDLGSDMRYNLAMIGAVANSGIGQVRIHWLFDLVQVRSMKASMPVQFDFTRLDQLIDLLYENGLRPGFELMGNPGNILTNFDDHVSVMFWKDLVYQTAKRYIDMYGVGYVMDWNFETWNEPDCHDFDGLNITVQGFLNYYDACSEGLKAASPYLRLGGPGDGCKRSTFSDALLQHVVNGTNYFTGERGVRIDFLSYHKKGSGTSHTIIEDELELMSEISTKYPSLANKPFFNDEADPLVGWSRDEEWRADSTYAAMVAKVIVQHQNAFISNPYPKIRNYTLLSNDNGFLSWYPHQFTQRTLLARFQMNNTSPPHTQFFQKPVYSLMGMLARLGESQIQAEFTSFSRRVTQDDDLGVLASVHEPEFNGTADSWQMAAIVYLSNDTGPQRGYANTELYINVQPPAWASQELMFVAWMLDNTVGSPYSLWVKEGRPDFPTLEQMNRIRIQEGASYLYKMPLTPGYQRVARFNFVEPAIMLYHVCSKPDAVPDQVNNVNVYNITGGQVLITWSDRCVNSRCVLYNEVAFSKTGQEDNYITISPSDFVGPRFSSNSFVYATTPANGTNGDENVVGFYKVRAVDYFSGKGEYSLPVHYP